MTPQYLGTRTTVAAALDQAAAALAELGDGDLARAVLDVAERARERARDEDTREFPILPPRKET